MFRSESTTHQILPISRALREAKDHRQLFARFSAYSDRDANHQAYTSTVSHPTAQGVQLEYLITHHEPTFSSARKNRMSFGSGFLGRLSQLLEPNGGRAPEGSSTHLHHTCQRFGAGFIQLRWTLPVTRFLTRRIWS
jgi:hypothetical protein